MRTYNPATDDIKTHMGSQKLTQRGKLSLESSIREPDDASGHAKDFSSSYGWARGEGGIHFRKIMPIKLFSPLKRY